MGQATTARARELLVLAPVTAVGNRVPATTQLRRRVLGGGEKRVITTQTTRRGTRQVPDTGHFFREVDCGAGERRPAAWKIMRHSRRAIAVAILQGLIRDASIAGAFGIVSLNNPLDEKSYLMRATEPVACSSSSSSRTFSSRRTRATMRRRRGRRRRCAACQAAPTAVTDGMSSEQAFAAGGAEKVAELLAVENPGEVFYNRVGAINRDLSVLMANVLAEERLREQLAAGNKRKRRRVTPLPSPPSPPAEEVVQDREGKNRQRGTTAVKSLLNRAFERCSRGRWGGVDGGDDGGDSPGLAKGPPSDERQEGQEGEEESGLIILDAFAASGVRALRYMTEVPGVQRVVANDYDVTAIERTRQAAELCGVGDRLEIHHGDAIDAMYAARAGGLGTYDLIDIDPFGCAAGFLDASVQAVSDGGLLCVTSTDMPVLSGVQPEVAWARYGSVPTRSGYHHEMSLRILLHAVSAAAGRHRRSIQPVLSVALDHYVRVFVRVLRSPKAALAAAQERTSYVLQSETCPSFFLLPVLLPPKPSAQTKAKSRARRRRRGRRPGIIDPSTSLPVGTSPQEPTDEEGDAALTTPAAAAAQQSLPPGLGGVCPETGGDLKAGGPIWSGPLHDEAWVARAIAIVSAADEQSRWAQEVGSPAQAVGGVVSRPRLTAGARVESLLKAVSRELYDVPLFYNLRDMFATLGWKKHPRREQVMGALEAAGYRTSGMHKEPLALKTDAPDAAVWDVLRCWARENPQPPPVRAAGLAILDRGTQMIDSVDFEATPEGAEGRAGGGAARGRGRFLHAHNPEQDWGPLGRRSVMAATGEDRDEYDDEEENAGKPAAVLLSE